MLKSFFDKRTERVFNGDEVADFDVITNRKAYKRLRILHRSNLQAVGNIKGNHLEKKEGQIRGLKNYPNKFYTIWVDGKYRIAFTHSKGDFYNVVIINYHK